MNRKTAFSPVPSLENLGRLKPAAWLAGLFLLAFALRVYHLDYQSLWRDEVDALRFSDGSMLTLLGMMNRQGHNGPLYFVVLRGWRALTGDSAFALRYFSVIGGMLALALGYRVGRRLGFGPVGALSAVALMATSPYLVWYAQEAKMYTWLMALILLAVYACQQAFGAARPMRWWLVFVAASSLSFYTHILSPLMLAVYSLWAAIQWRRLKLRWRAWALAMAALIAPYLPLVWWQAPLLFDGFNSGHPFYPFKQQLQLLLHFYNVGVLKTAYGPCVLGLGAAVALLGWFLPSLRMPWQRRWQVGLWVLTPALLVYLISLRVPVFEDRYLIYIAPAYYFLLAMGVTAIRTRLRGAGAVLPAIFLAFNILGVWQQAGMPIKADFRAAARYITQAETRPAPLNGAGGAAALLPAGGAFKLYLPVVERGRPAVAVMLQMPYLRYTFDYYYSGPYRALDGLWTNDGRTAESVAAEMAAVTGGLSELWLVVSEENQWDNRHLTRSWLDSYAQVADEAHFSGVDVYRYQFRRPD